MNSYKASASVNDPTKLAPELAEIAKHNISKVTISQK